MNFLTIINLNKPSFIPLPKFSLILKTIFLSRKINNTALPWTPNNDKYIWLSRSTFSLALIAKLRSLKNNNNQINVFIPDYYCNEALTLLRKEKVKIYFYQIDSDFQPCKQSIKYLLDSAIPDIIIQAHYFGKPSNISFLRSISDKYNSWLIEDSTHAILPSKGIGEKGDFILYSQYKHFPIPEGSLLVFRNKSILHKQDLNKIIDDLDIKSSNCIIKKSKLIFNLNWTVKRLFQKYLFNISLSILTPSNKKKSQFIHTGPRISQYSLNMLSNIIINLDYYKSKNKYNYNRIYKILSVLDNSNLDKLPTYNPYMISYSKANTNLAFKKEIDKQSSIWDQFPFLFWPDLPPEVISESYLHHQALQHYSNSIYLPVHISISKSQLDTLYYLCHKYRNNLIDLNQKK